MPNRHTDRTDDSSGKLIHLSDSDRFDIPDGEPDVRGWTVRTDDGRKVGKVEDLLVDTGVGKIRYLEVELASDARDESGREYALIPVGAARLNDNDDDVVVNERAAESAGLPRYDRERFSRDYEHSLRAYFDESGIRGENQTMRFPNDDDFYAHDAYDERVFFGSRRRGREDRPYLARRGD